jgi:hypothetical protein
MSGAPQSDRDLILERIDAADRSAAEREQRAEARHRELLAAIEARSTDGTIDSEAAAKLAGYPSTDALRVAAGRNPELLAARVGRGRWARERLIAATAKRRGVVR